MNKVRARNVLQKAGVRMPRAVSFTTQNDLHTGDMASMVFLQFGPPYIVKPPAEGAGKGIRIASNIVELPNAIADVLDSYGVALVEEYIFGEEVSVGIIEDFRNESLYALPPAHVSKEGSHLTLQHHESGKLSHAIPSRFSHLQKLSIADIAKLAHQALGVHHFSRSDVIVTPRSIYLLEVNTNPGLYQGASFPPMLESVGSSVREFLEHAIALARRES